MKKRTAKWLTKNKYKILSVLGVSILGCMFSMLGHRLTDWETWAFAIVFGCVLFNVYSAGLKDGMEILHEPDVVLAFCTKDILDKWIKVAESRHDRDTDIMKKLIEVFESIKSMANESAITIIQKHKDREDK